MTRVYGRMVGRVLCVAAACLIAGAAAAAGKPAKGPGGHPDLSGFWMQSNKVDPDKALMARIGANTAVLPDTGAVELPRGDWGGLKPKAKALAAAEQWNPRDDMSLTNACKPPSIIYSMQGPFPMEVYQGTELIIFKLEYFDTIRIVVMDGRKPDATTPESKVGYSVGHWEGDTLVVETTHLEAGTILNNGLSHSNKVHLLERFRVSADGTELLSTQEFDDPETLDNRGARFIGWKKRADHVYPYECDPTFALEYQKQSQGQTPPAK